MNKEFQTILLKIDALSVRERGILFVTLTLGVLMLGVTFLIEPQLKMQKILKTQHQSNLTQVGLLQEEIAQRQRALQVDPDTDIKAKILEAKARLAVMDQELMSLKKNLVPAEKMDGLLQDMLKRNKQLQLISMKSLPVVNLMEVPASPGEVATSSASNNQAAATNTSNTSNTSNSSKNMMNDSLSTTDQLSIYKHEVELELQGNYLDMLTYMKALEAMPERVYWSQSSLNVIEYPKASLKLRLFTLSLEKKWLNL